MTKNTNEKVMQYSISGGLSRKGQIPWHIGKHWSIEFRKKMSQTRINGLKQGKIKLWNKGLTKEVDLRIKKYSEAIKGKNNSQWLGGIGKEPYAFEFNEELKEKIRKRDNYKCQLCYITEEEHLIVFGKTLSIHHIDYDKKNCKEDNFVALCLNCHIRTNYNRTYWQEYFEKIMEVKYGVECDSSDR